MCKVTFSQRFLLMLLRQFFDGHYVRRKKLTGCGDLTSWIFFMGVSILINPGWVFIPMSLYISKMLQFGGEKGGIFSMIHAPSWTM